MALTSVSPNAAPSHVAPNAAPPPTLKRRWRWEDERGLWVGGGAGNTAAYAPHLTVSTRQEPTETFSSPLICSYDNGLLFGEFSVRSARRPEAAALTLAWVATSCSVIDTCCVPSINISLTFAKIRLSHKILLLCIFILSLVARPI